MAIGFAGERRVLKKIALHNIQRNPNQPRRFFDENGLKELADSIKRYGIITPLTVTRRGNTYELVAGERRLKAAKIAELSHVPCYVIEASPEDSSIIALVENIQRKDLDFFEEALALNRLTRKYGLTQQQAADKIGKTQSSVANKLRLLKLNPEVVEIIRHSDLTERHSRALLKIEDHELQLRTARHIVDKSMNVEQAENFIDAIINANADKSERKPKRQMYVKDVRIFINTVDKAVEMMKKSGISAEVEKVQHGDTMVITLTIQTNQSKVSV